MKKSVISLNIQASKASQILVVILFLFLFFLLDDFLIDLPWYLSIPIKIAVDIFVFFLIDFGSETRIQNGILMQGKYHRGSRFFKPIVKIPIRDIIEIDLVQNSEKYFQITAFGNNQEIIIKEFPNRNPAKLELEKIKAIIENNA